MFESEKVAKEEKWMAYVDDGQLEGHAVGGLMPAGENSEVSL
jgi:hypothetical protein